MSFKLPTRAYLIPWLGRVNQWRSRLRNTDLIRMYGSGAAGVDWSDCWKCQSKHEQLQLFCPACNTVQCVQCSGANYFQIFHNTYSKTNNNNNNINHSKSNTIKNITFDVDLSELKSYYIKLQSILHPDRYVNTSEREQEYSATLSAVVNDAYNTLNDPLKRGLYLLELNGCSLDSEAVVHEKENQESQALLNNIFMLNFEVDECEYEDELNDLLKLVQEDVEKDTESAALSFKENRLDDAKNALIKLRYRRNIQKKIEDKIFNLQFS